MYGIQEIDSEGLAEKLRAEPSAFHLIDVRGPGEWAQGVIAGAETVPLHMVPIHLQQLETDKPIVFYCRSGARSAQACAFFMARGNANVINLRGGVMDWVRRGLPLSPNA